MNEKDNSQLDQFILSYLVVVFGGNVLLLFCRLFYTEILQNDLNGFSIISRS